MFLEATGGNFQQSGMVPSKIGQAVREVLKYVPLGALVHLPLRSNAENIWTNRLTFRDSTTRQVSSVLKLGRYFARCRRVAQSNQPQESDLAVAIEIGGCSTRSEREVTVVVLVDI